MLTYFIILGSIAVATLSVQYLAYLQYKNSSVPASNCSTSSKTTGEVYAC